MRLSYPQHVCRCVRVGSFSGFQGRQRPIDIFLAGFRQTATDANRLIIVCVFPHALISRPCNVGGAEGCFRWKEEVLRQRTPVSATQWAL